jgi:hypothetical protein
MLAVNDKKYEVPYFQSSEDGSKQWVLRYTKGDDLMVVDGQFNYTFCLLDAANETVAKVTFTYNGNSVRPTIRALRMYGAQALAKAVSILATTCIDNYDGKVCQIYPYLRKMCGVESVSCETDLF